MHCTSPLKVYSFNGLVPVVHPESYVHPSAVLIGDVHIGPRCFIGPCVSLRADYGRIVIKAGSNIQDNCVVHVGARSEAIVEENGHVGHSAILHGCRVRKGALIGMGSIIMDMADIGDAAIVAAATFVKTAMQVPPRVMISGNPARVVRDLTEAEIAKRVRSNLTYQKLASRCLVAIQETTPLPEAEPGRQRMRFDGVAITEEEFSMAMRDARAARGLT